MSIADAPFATCAVPLESGPIAKAYWQTDASVEEISRRFIQKSAKAVIKMSGSAKLFGVKCMHCQTDMIVKNRSEAIMILKDIDADWKKIECRACADAERLKRMRAQFSKFDNTPRVEKRKEPEVGKRSFSKQNPKPKFMLGIWMQPGIRKATLSVMGTILNPLKLNERNLVSFDRFLFAAKAITGLETSETFEIAVVQIRDWIKRQPQDARQAMIRGFDAGILDSMPPAPEWAPRPKAPSVSRKPTAASVEKHPSVSMKEEFYRSWEWRTLRMEVFKQYGSSCQCCGAVRGQRYASGDPVRLCVDHIKPLSKHWDLRLDRSNLQILCDECNMGKGNWDETDFRDPAPSSAPDEWVIEDDGIDRGILEQLSVHGETLQ